MGKLSEQRRSAQRPGRSERARVKKHHRTRVLVDVPGAGTVWKKLGQKKLDTYFRKKLTARLLVGKSRDGRDETPKALGPGQTARL